MKTIKKHLLIGTGVLLAATSCSENAWNDHLDGFETPAIGAGTVTTDYVLTPADYKTIASLDANKAIAEEKGLTEELAAIGTNGCFATEEEAQYFVPALLETTNKGLPYYAYDNGSNVNVGVDVSADLPEVVRNFNASPLYYKVTDEDYAGVWGSATDYEEAFSPSHPAAGSLPAILGNNLTAKAGQYAVVSYNYTTTEPGSGDTPSTPVKKWEETAIAGTATSGDVEINGYVTAINSRGFIVTDKSGSILCYQSSGFDLNSVQIADKVTVSGTVSTYNQGYQIAITSDSYTVEGSGEYTYPQPKVVTGPDMDAAIASSDNFHPQYVSFTGKVSISGNYYNITVDGAQTAIGSLYMTPDFIKSQLENGGTYTFTGYYMAISGGKYYNLTCTAVSAPGKRAVRRAAPAAAQEELAVYRYDGSTWTAVNDLIILQPDAYKGVLGLSYANLSGSQPDQYLPVYLKQSFPYAQEGDAKTMVYYYYTSNGSFYQARQYVLTDGTWTPALGRTSLKYTRNDDKWAYNPSVEITLPYSRNTDPSYTYYMACVNWVLDNIVKPENPAATLTTATPLIDYRGNAEFYSGASAYYGNVDVRASTALNNCPDGYYDGLTDAEITALVKKRFCLETMRGAIEQIHADMKPVEGMDVTVTVKFTAYAPATSVETLVYTVVGPGKFKYKSCTWYTNGEDAGWE
ncbi:MAG: OB-fold nucleic acid binding domain-containing protein [Muribaculum sp.]|nr:OB-fold nucleic acid binding domain-containing protein [Muribaculum sp.]